MAVAHRVSTEDSSSGATTWTIARDAAVQDGDYVAINIATGTASTLSSIPSGFTSTSQSGANHDGHLIRGFAAAGHTDFNVTFSASETGAWGCHAFSGVDATTPLDVALVAELGGASTGHTTTIDPVTADCMLFSAIGWDAGVTITCTGTTDSGGTITEVAEIENAGDNCGVAAYIELLSGHASTTHTQTTSASVSSTEWMLALRPAAGGGASEALAAVVAAVSTVSASITRTRGLAAASAGVSTVAGAMVAARALAATVAGVSTVAGAISRRRGLAAASDAVSTVAAALSVATTELLAASCQAVSAMTASMRVAKSLAASVAGVSSFVASIFFDALEALPASGRRDVTAAVAAAQRAAPETAVAGSGRSTTTAAQAAGGR